jgi:hypothetical protein
MMMNELGDLLMDVELLHPTVSQETNCPLDLSGVYAVPPAQITCLISVIL